MIAYQSDNIKSTQCKAAAWTAQNINNLPIDSTISADGSKMVRIWRLIVALTLLLLFRARLFLLLFGSSKISFCGFRTLTESNVLPCGLTRALHLQAPEHSVRQLPITQPVDRREPVCCLRSITNLDALTENRYDYLDTKLPWLPYTIAGLVWDWNSEIFLVNYRNWLTSS